MLGADAQCSTLGAWRSNSMLGAEVLYLGLLTPPKRPDDWLDHDHNGSIMGFTIPFHHLACPLDS